MVGKYIFVLAGLFCILFFYSGYDGDNKEISIDVGIKKYSPIMSSVPGIPLTVKFKNGKKPENVIFNWYAEYGRFLSWDKTVNELGNDIKTQRDKIYWSDDFKENKVSHFTIILKVVNKNSAKIMAESSIVIEKDREGYFEVKK